MFLKQIKEGFQMDGQTEITGLHFHMAFLKALQKLRLREVKTVLNQDIPLQDTYKVLLIHTYMVKAGTGNSNSR